ncbi:cytochrome P450 [Chloroflexi bacterium TSY]|nr:cytochrome P450 [Chloroflexi bacterium TSY]
MSNAKSQQSPTFNIFGPAFKADPYPTYAAMRTQCPIHRRTSQDGETTIWFVTGYEQVTALLRDRRLVKDVRQTLTTEEQAATLLEPPLLRLLSNHMLNLDPPDHTRLRGLVSKAFTKNMVDQMEPRIQQIADRLIDKVQHQGQMDLIDDYAFPLPITVIAELLGVPSEDRNRFRQWSRAFVTPSANIHRSEKKFQKTRRLMEDFTEYFRQIFVKRRAEPRDDLISSLLEAEEAGDRLNQEELFSMIILLIVAGHETMVNLIGNGMLALSQNPQQMQQLRDNPCLIDQAIDEMIRYDGPVERAMMRFAAEGIVIENIVAGESTQLTHIHMNETVNRTDDSSTRTSNDQIVIKRGDVVSLILAAANRDPAQYEAADHFNITRSPNRHVGFG